MLCCTADLILAPSLIRPPSISSTFTEVRSFLVAGVHGVVLLEGGRQTQTMAGETSTPRHRRLYYILLECINRYRKQTILEDGIRRKSKNMNSEQRLLCARSY